MLVRETGCPVRIILSVSLTRRLGQAALQIDISRNIAGIWMFLYAKGNLSDWVASQDVEFTERRLHHHRLKRCNQLFLLMFLLSAKAISGSRASSFIRLTIEGRLCRDNGSAEKVHSNYCFFVGIKLL